MNPLDAAVGVILLVLLGIGLFLGEPASAPTCARRARGAAFGTTEARGKRGQPGPKRREVPAGRGAARSQEQ